MAGQKILQLTMAAILFFSVKVAYGQSYYYFQDSPSSEYYDYSWMDVTAPSILDRAGAESRRFPVASDMEPQQGFNCLRLTWTSNTGGNWYAIAAGLNWTAKDISNTDTLVFYVRSEVLFDNLLLPTVFMEDVTNKKSDLHLISDWAEDLQAGIWTAIRIPMRVFFEANDGTDWTQIKTIGFSQSGDDGGEHTLYIDDMRVVKGSTMGVPAGIPAGVRVKGYDKHIEIQWDKNPESDIRGYQVERLTSTESIFKVLAITSIDENYYLDWTGDLAQQDSVYYRVKAINAANESSIPSDTVASKTRTFSDEELLDMVQEYTFRYFWDFGHEVSGLTRERSTSATTVTSGGSGFGMMAIIVGIERGFITREEGAARILTMLEFLEDADRFHGAWPHWLNGETGAVIPFSTKDNGGDLVETSYVAEGLLIARQYFTADNETEKNIITLSTSLWESIEWDWYRRSGSASLYWHWSPDYNWDMNMKITGWNEAAITYLLAIAAPVYGVPATLWETGWAGGSVYLNPRTYYDYQLWVGNGYGGPLFFAHYSFLGFNPNNIADEYANYFDHNRNHSLIQQAYCAANPYGFTGYSADCWGLTASDDPDGYAAHAPYTSNDNGTISPTAALSSFPYTPDESMRALKHFYRNKGEKIWGWMGFKDAFNESRNWYADTYLAIDQGPIIGMIENYRTGLLWDLFMANPEIGTMLDAIGFKASPNQVETENVKDRLLLFPNPANEIIHLNTSESGSFSITTISGNVLFHGNIEDAGITEIPVQQLKTGIYLLSIRTSRGNSTAKFIKN